MPLNLLPRPRRVEVLDGRYRPFPDPLEPILDPTLDVRPQGYTLTVEPGGVVALAKDAAGVRNARATWAQIAAQADADGTVPCVAIVDWPDFPRRGVMLDISRDKVPTNATLKALIDLLAGWKINELQLYMEHTFAYREHREVWEHASPLDAGEIEDLDAYCRERGIELVPNQNSFGHMERWLRHPRYADLAEVPYTQAQRELGEDPGYRSLCPVDPRSIELIASLYRELLPCFTSGEINVGCDETLDLGKGRSADAVARLGAGRVYLDFLRQIHAQASRHGRTMLFWGDIILNHPELIRALPSDAIALNWGYEADHPFDEEGRKFADAGVAYRVCPGTSSWLSLGGRTDNAIANLRSAAENGLRHGAGGYLVTDWGDFGHWQPLPVSYPGFAYGAAVSWGLEANRDLDLRSFVGATAYDLGNVYRETGVLLKNASALAILLLFPDRSMTEGRLSELTIEGLERAAAAIPPSDDPELKLAASLMHHACRLGIARKRAPDHRVESILHGERLVLAYDLGRIVEDYRELWLQRNRPGGLDDSVGRLERLVARYRA
jgi:hypothetical protein